MTRRKNGTGIRASGYRTLFPRTWLWVFMSLSDKQVLSRERDLAWVSGTLNYLHRHHTECKSRKEETFVSFLFIPPFHLTERQEKRRKAWETFCLRNISYQREQDVLEEQRAWFRYTLYNVSMCVGRQTDLKRMCFGGVYPKPNPYVTWSCQKVTHHRHLPSSKCCLVSLTICYDAHLLPLPPMKCFLSTQISS